MSKGKPKPKLRDLGHVTLKSTEVSAILHSLVDLQQPIATAILGAILVEHDLDREIRRRLRRSDDSTWEMLVTDRGPLNSFSSKIKIAYALGVFKPEMRDALNIVRNVRNAFAHSRQLINFDHELIVGELRSSKVHERRIKALIKQSDLKSGAREAYASLCMILSSRLLAQTAQSLRRHNKRAKLKHQRVHNALTAYLKSTQPKSPESPLGRLLFGQTEHPNPPTPGGLLSGLMDLGEEYLRRQEAKEK